MSGDRVAKRAGTGRLAGAEGIDPAVDHATQPLVKFTDAGVVYCLDYHDGLGSTIAFTDETGQIVESYT